jgi:hypothetical protein
MRHTPRAWQRQPVLDQIEVVALLLVRNAMASSGTLDEQTDLNQTDNLQTILACPRQTESAVVIEV